MQYIRKWLRVERSGVALHPSQTIELDVPAHEAFGRIESIVANDLGGHITASTPFRHVEASFGLVNSERLSVEVEALAASRVRVSIHSRALAAPNAVAGSQYVEALARLLTTLPR